ncbi:MAG: hypothetical protein MAG551_01224 [Candidatus Scalindua arabica]|uniref:Transglutaminase-like domain-containing protein n=1 Tax=Candidatus Scalindua arabica TaxID=1127984 RepID=A0A941W3E0_9BACT|nr:hypothetical protein [Candidatus Scalindua arabica]
MAKRLKLITYLVFIFIMLSLLSLSFAIGYDQPDAPLSVHSYTKVIHSSGPELIRELFLPERFVQAFNRADKAILEKTRETSECYYAGNFSKPGFKPVPDECPYPENNEELLQDNLRYKEWCEETFENGKYIYEAYKDIAFNIKYVPEQAKTDIWQTPFETKKSKKGDCEDAVFLFSSHLPSKQRNAMIVWGWVIDKKSRVARAHVWYQLIDKVGQQYIVEGFSKDWNGIIPMGIVELTESRKPIFSITHSEVCRLAELTSNPGSWQTYQSLIDFCRSANFIEFYSINKNISQDIDSQHNLNYGFVGYLLNTPRRLFEDTTFRRNPSRHRISPFESKEIPNILKELYKLFTKCERQRVSFGLNLQIAYRNMNNKHPDRNLNCTKIKKNE